MDLKKIQSAIENGEMDQAICTIETLTHSPDKMTTEYLLHILMNTENHALRNAIALKLSDFQCSEMLPFIIQLLTDPKTVGNRGTLLHSIRELDYSDYIDELTPLLSEKGFEVSRETFQLLKSHFNSISKNVKKETKWTIKDQIADLEEELAFKKKVLKKLSKK